MGVDYGSLTPDGRWQVAEALLASWSGVLAEVCELVRAVDAAGDWRLDGVGSLQDWLAQAGTLSAATARDVVRTAQRLGELPALSAALSDGRLSWDQVRPASRLADPE
ncbi:MAG TPA: DUF222 domain-containing protein, partial [Acidimicrobiales bacterium]|nr:DUF222 domain-containing protein [Acidimicrobiales bacterium]